VGGYIFDRFGCMISFQFLSGFALAMCITQTIVNWLIKDKNLKKNASCTDGSTTVNDNL